MRRDDPSENPLLNSIVCYFGSPKTPKVEKVKIPKAQPIEMPPIPPAPKFEMPKQSTAAEIAAAMPKPVPAEPIPPAPTTSPLEAQEAATEEQRKQGRRQGYAASIIAGEQQQDYQSSATPTGSLLG